MTPLKALKKIVGVLENRDCNYCLIGGHAASLYRSKERFTKDVDFALVATDREASQEFAKECIRSIGFVPMLGFIPLNNKGSKRKSVCMVTSSPPPNETNGLIDILLPELPWVEDAVERAQFNRLDLGFANVPVITPEDLIIAKCYALRNSPDRFQDLDDLKELFKDVTDLDTDYLRGRMTKHSLSFPEPVAKYAPFS